MIVTLVRQCKRAQRGSETCWLAGRNHHFATGRPRGRPKRTYSAPIGTRPGPTSLGWSSPGFFSPWTGHFLAATVLRVAILAIAPGDD